MSGQDKALLQLHRVDLWIVCPGGILPPWRLFALGMRHAWRATALPKTLKPIRSMWERVHPRTPAQPVPSITSLGSKTGLWPLITSPTPC